MARVRGGDATGRLHMRAMMESIARAASLGFDPILGLDARRSKRKKMGAAEVLAVLKGDPLWRFRYAIAEIAERDEVWFLVDDIGNFASEFKSEGRWVSLFWPSEPVAELVAGKFSELTGKKLQAEPMPIDHWIDQVLDVECREGECQIALCPDHEWLLCKTIEDVFAELASCKADQQAYGERYFSQDRFYIKGNMSAGPTGRLP